MDTAALLKKVRKIEIKTRGLSKHIFSGEYHSAFKGRGMSFSEVREYTYGDEVRSIDWNVTARTGDPHVKVFEEERELTVMLMADISGSQYFGTEEQDKRLFLTEIAAVLAFSANQNNDKVGLLLFTDKTELYIPPQKGKKHILRIIRELLHFEPVSKGTDVGKAIEYVNRILKKRSICFLLSDFIGSDFSTHLRVMARRHDLVGLHLFDPFEEDIPEMGVLPVMDMETGETAWLDTNDKKSRQRYLECLNVYEQRMKDAFRLAGCDLLSISVQESYTKKLMQFFKKRMQR